MHVRTFEAVRMGAAMLAVLSGIQGCLPGEPKVSSESTVGEQTKQVSAQMDKPYLLNEKGEVIQSIPPEILAAIKEDLRNNAKMSARATLEDLYDPATGNLKNADKIPEIQHQADQISQALSKRGAL